MLIWMRNGAGSGVMKYFLMSFLVLAVAGLVLMDVGGFFRGDMASGTIVKGGGLNISAPEFDRTVRRVLASQNIPPQEAYRMGLINNILESEIQGRLFSRDSAEMGLRVDDESVREQVARMMEPLAVEGRSRREVLFQILRTQGISEGEFVSSIRNEMANALMRSAVQPPENLASPLLVNALYRYDNERRSAEIITLDDATVPGIAAPAAEDIEQYYEANKARYLIPETRTVSVATLKSEMVKEDLNITEDALRAEYERNRAAFTKPARRSVDQAIFETREQADAALAAVEEGKTLQNAAGAQAYTGRHELERDGLAPEIAAPVFRAAKGDVIGPVQTALGWHVLVLHDILPSSVTPFEQVRARLVRDLEHSAMGNLMFETANTIEDRVAAGDTLESLVTDYGMTTRSFAPLRDNGMSAEGKYVFEDFAADAQSFIDAAFTYDQGEIAPLIETADGQFHLLRVDHVTPAAHKPLDEVRADIERTLLAERRRKANHERAAAALGALQDGEDIAAVATAHNGTRRTLNNLSRREDPPAPLTALSAVQVFAAAQGESFTAETETGLIVGRVTAIDAPSSTENAAYSAELSELSARTLAQSVLSQYVSGLMKGKNIRINQQTLQQLYGGVEE